jgi:stress response protein YsnF
VRTDRETLEVPTRREEVSVERVPLNSETSGAELGDDEISVTLGDQYGPSARPLRSED